jgi:amicyanin
MNGVRASRSPASAGGWRALALVAALLVCGARADTPSGDPLVRVSVKGFRYAAPTLTIKAGTTVTWTNLDEEPHTVASDGGAFRSGALDTNERFSFRFTAPGTYPYHCTLHPYMTGSIVVE